MTALIKRGPSGTCPGETHLACSTVLLGLVAETLLAPTTVAIAAVRRASLGPLPLVGPGMKPELESDVTCICASDARCASQEAYVLAARGLHRGSSCDSGQDSNDHHSHLRPL